MGERDQIINFLLTVHGKKSDKVVRQMVAEKFNGTITLGRYVKIGENEYLIRNDSDCRDTRFCGYSVRLMNWSHAEGEDSFRYCHKY